MTTKIVRSSINPSDGVNWNCRVGNVWPRLKLIPPSDDIEVIINSGDEGVAAAWAGWHSVMEQGATSIAVVSVYPNGSVGTSFGIGRSGSYINLLGGVDVVKDRIMATIKANNP